MISKNIVKKDMIDLLYIGSVCNQKYFEKTVRKSKIKPSSSAQNFENSLVSGINDISNVKLRVITVESIAPFPKGNRFLLKRRLDNICDNLQSIVIPALNIPIIKQFCHQYFVRKEICKWLKTTNTYKAILLYGLYPYVAKVALNLSKKYNFQVYIVVTDIPETYLTLNKNHSVLKHVLSTFYRQKAISLQNKFDGYIYLAESMKNKVAPDKPYIVIDSIIDANVEESEYNSNETKKSKAILYAGTLCQKYGIDVIIESFLKSKIGWELWICGSGDFEDEISEYANNNSNIYYFGRLSKKEVIQKEREASLLINLRNPSDEYTRYSMPSKLVEYMSSGTPVITTRLEGIPKEYYRFLYIVDKYNPADIGTEIFKISHIDEDALQKKGIAAMNYVKKNKNKKVQSEKIVNFIISNIDR